MADDAEVLTDRELGEAMDDDIRATLKDIQSRAPKEEASEAAPIDNVPAEDIAASEAKGEEQRARDEKGKFAKKQDSAAPAKADTPETPVAAAAPEQAAADTEQLKFGEVPVDLNRPPSSWKPAAKAQWAALPEAIRAEVYRRETNYSNEQRGIRENADFGQAVKTVIDPYRALILAEGGTPERAIADTMKTAALFRTGSQQAKLQALFDIDRQFGAGLNQHFAAAVQAEVAKRTGGAATADGAAAAAQPFLDPRVDTILQSLQEQDRQRQAFERERQAQAAEESNKAVQDFMAAKDAKGAPLYPFVDNVLADMSERVAILRRQNPALEHAKALQQAYEAAVWANPETRAVLIAAQQAQAQAPADSQRKVTEAKRASAGNVPKRGALPASSPALNLDDTIRETARELGMF